MKLSLLFTRKSVSVFAVLCIGYTAGAQQLKTQADQQPITKGHSLYKASKLYDSKSGPVETKISRVGDRALDRMEYEFNLLKNPYSGKIPKGIKDLEIEFSKKINTGDDFKKSAASMKGSFSYWKNRGPHNVGGRTRALAIDATNENVIFAGGVSGGLWRSTNGGTTWKKVTRPRQSPSITCIVQDPRPRKQHIWYYGSGERSGNSASGGGAFYGGNGVYKSMNGGRTWRLLQATNDGEIGSFSSFDLINSIAVDPTNGDLYVATFEGLHRSQDGGRSFEEVLAGGRDNRVEVTISSTGVIYATIDSEGDPNKGFFTSTDGANWTDITPETMPETYGRTVMGIDPSNENTVYFFSQTPAGAGELLFKYDAGAGSWTELTENLPNTIGGRAGNLNLQGGYNMVVKVHPSNSDMVFVGGTNLYRSETGFTTPTGREGWVAGYTAASDSYALYPNQHPDQHALVFYPSNPDKVLTGNDGGVFVTEDITATSVDPEAVVWTSLNNGYVTTQPYAFSFDPDANSDDMLAGFQDNGTWFTNSTNPTEAWAEDFGGDGSVNAIADGGRTRYVSSQFGNVYRLNFDEAGEYESFTRVRPAGANGLGFVAPFILDPNNDNIMYMPAGNIIWRNNNLDEIPLFSNALATVNWVSLANTAAGGTITALGVSKYPVANRLYYGTNNGFIYRMDNANIDNQAVVDISSGKGLPPGHVSDITVDPSNSDRLIVSFSNYGIQSLFLSDDAGETWVNISGNLEENPDGTGNGPSVRGAAFFGSSQGFFGTKRQKVFAATSTGLYYANSLRGEKTRWIKEPIVIGNAVIHQVKTRKDGFVGVAAHGNGLFSARFPMILNQLPESTLSVAYLLPDLDADVNSEDTVIDVEGLFTQSAGNAISIELTNSNPDLVTATLSGNTLTLSYATDGVGQASIGLIATSGKEKVAEGFTVSVSKPALYEQTAAAINSTPSQLFLDFGGLAQSADDFVVPEGYTWKVDRVLAFGGANNAPELTNATVVIYADNGGVPGDEVYNSGALAPISEPNDANLNLLLPEELVLESGNYWLSVYVNLTFNPGATQWFWSSQEAGIGAESHFKDDLNLFGTGATDWTSLSVAFGKPQLDQVFQIYGIIQESGTAGVGQEVAKDEALVTLDAELKTAIWPNPSYNTFMFNFRAMGAQKKVSLHVFDITGKMVHEASDIDVRSEYVWNASDRPAGFYFVKIEGEGISKNLKLIKR
ncbi:T9SS type A sorting domain-containing protein [Aquimarina hainanensis]|uniref:T9SS type A sorting domain-containing protein n=1 Tax=Aquimarina hainanensis TaxID=1578017 RepID=A0ABW5N595_9FLAO